MPPAINSHFIQNFKNEVKKSLLLEEEDVNYWLANVEKLPKSLIEYFYKNLKRENKLVKNYFEKGFEIDPDLLNQMKNKLKMVKKHILQIKEKADEEKENPDIYLEQNLKNI